MAQQQPNKVFGALAGVAAFGSGLAALWSYHQNVSLRCHHVRSCPQNSRNRAFLLLLQTLREVTKLRQELARLQATAPNTPSNVQVSCSAVAQENKALLVSPTVQCFVQLFERLLVSRVKMGVVLSWSRCSSSLKTHSNSWRVYSDSWHMCSSSLQLLNLRSSAKGCSSAPALRIGTGFR